MDYADLILYNAKIHCIDKKHCNCTALAIREGRFMAMGTDAEMMKLADASTLAIDIHQKRIIPGINDSHIHLIRGGLNYNLELRWDGVPSLADALRMLKEQVARTPSPQWVRVVGGWSAFQFAEKRMPSLDEINAIAPDTPVFILHLYDRALLNRAALRAIGYTKDTTPPPGGYIEKGPGGEPSGLFIATPNALVLYAALVKGPRLSFEHQLNSTQHFMTELNRFGITSVIDAGGGSQHYPEDYQVIEKLNDQNLLTIRIAYNLFTQRPGKEYEDFDNWTKTDKYGQGNDMYRHNGAGEMLVFSAADFEDFAQPRPDLPEKMEADLEKVVRLLVEKKWAFRLHATYNESITRFLNVFEKVNRDIPFDGLHWIFDHAETIDEKNIERVKALGGGIAIQSRMAYQGEYFTERYGANAALHTPPVKRMLSAEVPVGGGSDATRVSSYNPWISMYWLTSGKTAGGLQLYDYHTTLDRHTALELYTKGGSWFSNEQGKKGDIMPGMLADLAVLDRDYFTVADESIKEIESLMTIVGGKIVYARDIFAPHSPSPVPAMPDWSPANFYNGYGGVAKFSTSPPNKSAAVYQTAKCNVHGHSHPTTFLGVPVNDYSSFWGALGCSCFAF